MGLLELTLLAALAVALVAIGRIAFVRHQATLAHEVAETTLKEMLGDPKYSERSFDVLKLSIDAYDDEDTRAMLRDMGAKQIDDGGRELWAIGLQDATASDETMPSA